MAVVPDQREGHDAEGKMAFHRVRCPYVLFRADETGPPDAIGGRRGCALQECDGARREVEVILEERWRMRWRGWAIRAGQATAAKENVIFALDASRPVAAP